MQDQHELQTQQEEMIGKVVDGDDCQRLHAHGPMILGKIGARVVEDLVAVLVGEECQRRGQETPVRVRGGVINKANGGRRAPKG